MAFPTTVVFIFLLHLLPSAQDNDASLKFKFGNLLFRYTSQAVFSIEAQFEIRGKFVLKIVFTVFVYILPFSHTMGASVPSTQFSQDVTEFILLIFKFSPILRRSIKEKGLRS